MIICCGCSWLVVVVGLRFERERGGVNKIRFCKGKEGGREHEESGHDGQRGLLLVGVRSRSGRKQPMNGRETGLHRLRHPSVIGLDYVALGRNRHRGANGCATVVSEVSTCSPLPQVPAHRLPTVCQRLPTGRPLAAQGGPVGCGTVGGTVKWTVSWTVGTHTVWAQ